MSFESFYDPTKPVGYQRKEWYYGVAWVKGLKRIKLAEVKSMAVSSFWGSPGDQLLIFDHAGRLLESRTVPATGRRRFCRDMCREFRQGTRKELIRQAEANLRRLTTVFLSSKQ